jgi:hypothetical protein
MQYVKRTWDRVMTLSADDLHILRWYVDASFGVHPDFKSHSGAVLTLGKGAQQTISAKQKLNVKSSTVGELVACDDASTKILWTQQFMEAQGYKPKKNVVYQDNKQTILYLKNGRASTLKRTRAINIRYFFLADQCQKGNIDIRWCPTKQMLGDPMTKPLQGKEFHDMTDYLLGKRRVPEPDNKT